jgi:hypothetical protein
VVDLERGSGAEATGRVAPLSHLFRDLYVFFPHDHPLDNVVSTISRFSLKARSPQRDRPARLSFLDPRTNDPVMLFRRRLCYADA